MRNDNTMALDDQSLGIDALEGHMAGLRVGISGTVTVRVRVSPNNVELGVSLEMRDGWTLRELMGRIDLDPKVALYRDRGAELKTVDTHGHVLYGSQGVDARHETLCSLNIGPATRHPCLNLVYVCAEATRMRRVGSHIRIRKAVTSRSPLLSGISKSAPNSPLLRGSLGSAKGILKLPRRREGSVAKRERRTALSASLLDDGFARHRNAHPKLLG
jgi:hypothetical protein